MLRIIALCLFAAASYAAPGYLHGLDLGPPLISAPLLHAPVVKALPAPILAPAPIYAHAPIVKTIAPATSYASVTIAHPAPIIKTILAPQPILKSYIPAPIAYGHGYH